MSDDYKNAKTLKIIAQYSLEYDLIIVDGETYVHQESYADYWAENGARLERERVIALLEARRYDIASCLKDDDCAVRADAIEVCISDIKGEKE
jgi:hypothetical protein